MRVNTARITVISRSTELELQFSHLCPKVSPPGAISHLKNQKLRKKMTFQKESINLLLLSDCYCKYLPLNVAADFHCIVYESAPDRLVQKDTVLPSSFRFIRRFVSIFAKFSQKVKIIFF